MAQSDDNNYYFFGVGPYQNGSVRSEVSNGLNTQPATYQTLPYNVAFDDPQSGQPGSSSVRWASSSDEDTRQSSAVKPASH